MADPVSDPGAALRPGRLALTFVDYQTGADATLELHRTRSAFVRRWTAYGVLIALLLAVVPALVVAIRREPAYVTDFVLAVAAVLVVLIVAGFASGSWLWSRSAAGRAHFDRPVLILGATGLTVPGAPDVVADWDDVLAVRRFGRAATLAVDLAPAVGATPPLPEDAEDEASAESLPDDDDARPTSRTHAHDSEADPSAIVVEPTPPPAPRVAPPEPTWDEKLYGTRHVLDIRGTTPGLTTVSETLATLTRGRLTVR